MSTSEGREHEVFRKDVGTWDAEVTVSPAPGAPPQKSRGVTESRMVGNWLVMHFKNETSGFEGQGIYGWDAAKKHYVGTWVDSMRTFMNVSQGTWDPAKRTMTFLNEAGAMKWREVTHQISDDEQVYRSLVATPDGGEYEMMTITYRRRR